jgi:membrane protease subunit HflK
MNSKKESKDVVFIQNAVRVIRRRKAVLLSFIPVALLVLILLQGIYTVPVNERGALFLFGKLRNDNIAPGIHFKLPKPVHTLKIMNIDEIRSMKMVKEIRGAIPMITGDENIIQIGIAVQYKITGYGDYLKGAENWEKVLNLAATACLTDLIACMEVDEVLTTGKSIIQARLLQRTQKLLKQYKSGISLFSVTIENIKPPTECQDSFRMVANARNERAEKINIAQSNRERRLSSTRGEAVSITLQAESEAEEIIKFSQGECYRYEALVEEYQKAKNYTVTNFYLSAMEKLIARAEILIVDSENAEKINLNHFLQNEQQTVGNESTLFSTSEAPVTAQAQPVSEVLSAAAASAPPQTTLDKVLNLQKEVQEERRVHAPARR